MLTTEDNDLLTRVGPGTPMGALLRQFWTPFLPSADLPEVDGPPKRVRLLAEDLVAFRDTNGDVGLVEENCPHRGASLFFGRNEFCGLACNYHGWKYDVTGACVDMPNEPPESNFKDKVRITAYPVRDVNGVLWAYMGPRETPPPFPEFEINTLPPENVFPPHMMLEECNWVQGLEGDLDSSHVFFLHGRIAPDGPAAEGLLRLPFGRDLAPTLDVVPTPYGAVYSAKRINNDEGQRWHRITQFIFPYFTMVAAGVPNSVSARAWVPIDDDYHMLISMRGKLDGPVTDEERARALSAFDKGGGYVPETPDPRTRYLTAANRQNDYAIDYEVQKNINKSGIPPLGNLQDRAMTETMGKIYDRRKEHLGTSDRMIIFARQQLMKLARDYQEDGSVPALVDDAKLYRVRSASALLQEGEDWQAATAQARDADGGVPLSWVPLFD
jgi:phenylpropionate dioxygenase-like ring-hydroxylating dioxygenase large terminal subunit